MKKVSYIRESRMFFGKYEVVDSFENVIPCYNLATARSIVKRLNGEKEC
tara:strand:- start:45 stop:191 length:147 start_codon:yes stop_codon:yes gene_type:complete